MQSTASERSQRRRPRWLRDSFPRRGKYGEHREHLGHCQDGTEDRDCLFLRVPLKGMLHIPVNRDNIIDTVHFQGKTAGGRDADLIPVRIVLIHNDRRRSDCPLCPPRGFDTPLPRGCRCGRGSGCRDEQRNSPRKCHLQEKQIQSCPAVSGILHLPERGGRHLPCPLPSQNSSKDSRSPSEKKIRRDTRRFSGHYTGFH
jgi:hypothetical protein